MASRKISDTPDLAEYVEGQTNEWGTWVAVGSIDIGGARAFNDGYPVPASHVDSGIVRRDQVRPAAAEAERPTVSVVRPFGADTRPDPADIEAADKANREAGAI
jgi:hypothetical protein